MIVITEQQQLLLLKLAQLKTTDKTRQGHLTGRSLRPSIFLNDVDSIAENLSLPVISSPQADKRRDSQKQQTNTLEAETPQSERDEIKLPKIGRFSHFRKSSQQETQGFRFLSHQNSPIRNLGDFNEIEDQKRRFCSKSPLKKIETINNQGIRSRKKKSVKFNPEIEMINQAGEVSREHIEIPLSRQTRFRKRLTKLHTQAN